DRARRMRGIWPTVQVTEVADFDSRDPSWDQFPIVEYVWVVGIARHGHSGTGFCLVEEVSRIDRDSNCIHTSSDQQLVDLGWTDGPYMAQRIGLVRTIEKLRRAITVAIKRLQLKVGVMLPAKSQSLL